MALVLTHALRLRRADLDRLTDTHRNQFVQAIAPGNVEMARGLIEEAGDPEGDAHGLVYLRFEDAAASRAFEGWFLDDARHPSKKASLDGGAFFAAGTLDEVEVELSQSTPGPRPTDVGAQALYDAVLALGPKIAVKTSGPELKSNPPFAFATAPKIEMEKGALALEVVEAKRYTAEDIAAAGPDTQYQVMVALQSKFAGKREQIETAITRIYEFGDPGSKPKRGLYAYGIVFLRLREENGARGFDGWFWDMRQKEPSAYWPSKTTTLGSGSLLVAGTFTPTGVELTKGKLKVACSNALPVAAALAAGFKKLGLTFDVTLVHEAASGESGYFGSPAHQSQLRMFPDA
ncbi:MAG: hypothetical protein JST54_15450 [Deltaproteobacteria bacterium]|nr:hypothetical protein [Deltaproteobacteria bacterium]